MPRYRLVHRHDYEPYLDTVRVCTAYTQNCVDAACAQAQHLHVGESGLYWTCLDFATKIVDNFMGGSKSNNG